MDESAPPDPQDEARWIAASQRGDLEAFGALVRLHQQEVRAFLRSRLTDWAAADDLAQDAFLTAFGRIRTFRGGSELRTWLLGIAFNGLRNHVRKRRREVPLTEAGKLELLLAERTTADTVADRGEKLDALRRCLAKLAGPARDLVRARYETGRPIVEIAAEHGRGTSAVAMELHRIRRVLGACVDRETKGAGA